MNYSIVIIARNEEDTLPRLMKSISAFTSAGGKVFVTDTGSTDNTVEVAKDLGCIVSEKSFDTFLTAEEAKLIPGAKEGDRVFDFSAARNWASEQADTDWIHVMPCDEEWPEYDYELISSTMDDTITGITCGINYHLVDGVPTVSLNHNTIYNKKKMTWVGMVHEYLFAENPVLKHVRITSNHYKNMNTDRSHYLLGLGYDYLVRGNANLRNCFYYGRELMYRGYYAEALPILSRVAVEQTFVYEKSEAMVLMGKCLMQLGDVDQALSMWASAVIADPQRREPAMNLATFYYNQHDVNRSLFWVSAALTITNVPDYTREMQFYGALPYKILYWALYHSGQMKKATEAFQIAFALDPQDPQMLAEREFFI